VLEPDPGDPGASRTYYQLADQIALEVSYGLSVAGEIPAKNAALQTALS